MSVRPVPSRSSSTSTLDSLVARSIRAVRPVVLGRSQSCHLHSGRPVNAVMSCGVPTDTRSHPSGPTSRIRTPRSSRPCQIACRSSNRPNSTKFASESATVSPRSRSQTTRASRSSRSDPTCAISAGACRSAARATACVTADRWYGSRTTRERVDQGRRRRQVADARAGQAERLRHGAADREVRVVGEQLERRRRAGAAELAVGLVDDDHAAARAPAAAASSTASTVCAGSAVPVGLFGLARSTTDGACSAIAAPRDVGVEPEVRLATARDPAGERVAGVLGVHRVRRREGQHRATRTAERLQDVQHDLVRAVGGPDLLGRQRDAGLDRAGSREVGAQRLEVAVGVAVQPRGGLRRRRPRCRRRRPAPARTGSR